MDSALWLLFVMVILYNQLLWAGCSDVICDIRKCGLDTLQMILLLEDQILHISQNILQNRYRTHIKISEN